MCKHYIWSEETDGTLEKKLRHWQIFRRHSPPSPPSLLLLPFASTLSGKRKKINKTLLKWLTLQSILTLFKNGTLDQQLWNSSFVTICRMRLVRSLLSLLLGFSTVSSKINEDGDLIDNNSILEVELPRFYLWPSSRPRDSIFCIFFAFSTWRL